LAGSSDAKVRIISELPKNLLTFLGKALIFQLLYPEFPNKYLLFPAFCLVHFTSWVLKIKRCSNVLTRIIWRDLTLEGIKTMICNKKCDNIAKKSGFINFVL